MSNESGIHYSKWRGELDEGPAQVCLPEDDQVIHPLGADQSFGETVLRCQLGFRLPNKPSVSPFTPAVK